MSYTASQGYRVAFTGQAPQNTLINTLNGTPVATADLPLPGFPNFDRTAPPPGSNVFSVPTTKKTSNVQQFSFQAQQQFGAKTVITLGYVGNKATHLATGYNFNFADGSRSTARFPELTTSSQVVYNANDGVSHYNSLQAQFNYHATKGLNLTTSYTWSHDIDNTDGYLGFYAVSSARCLRSLVEQGQFRTRSAQCLCRASAVYDLPFGKGQRFASGLNRGLNAVVGGWQLNSIVQAETGNPFSIVFPSYGGVYSQRADVVGVVGYPHSVTKAFFTGKFVAPTGLQGNTGRNQFFGPGLAEGDVSLFKNVAITERVGAELRAEVFNVTNTPQFTNPDSNPQDGTNGVADGINGGFGRINGTRQASERQMQMAVRFTF